MSHSFPQMELNLNDEQLTKLIKEVADIDKDIKTIKAEQIKLEKNFNQRLSEITAKRDEIRRIEDELFRVRSTLYYLIIQVDLDDVIVGFQRPCWC